MPDTHNHQMEPFHYYLQPGYIFATTEPSIISAVLGSGVVVCLWDQVLGIGGMTHFQRARPGRGDKKTVKFGVVSVVALTKMLIKLGARKENLQAQIYGGGHRYHCAKDIGRKNVESARRTLKRSRIPIVSEDVGGVLCRRLLYHTRTNEALCMKTNKSHQVEWYPFLS